MLPAVHPMDQSPSVPLQVVLLLIFIQSMDQPLLPQQFTITWQQVLIPLM